MKRPFAATKSQIYREREKDENGFALLFDAYIRSDRDDTKGMPGDAGATFRSPGST